MINKLVREEDFDAAIREGIWIVDFFTTHCGPCKVLDITMNFVLNENPEINLLKCNLDELPNFQERFEITGVPTLLFMNDGRQTGRTRGAISKDELEAELSKCMYGE